MPYRQKLHTPEQVTEQVEKITKNPNSLARWLLLIGAVKTIDEKDSKLGLDEKNYTEGHGNRIAKFIDDNEDLVLEALENRVEGELPW